jgi:hypothetical protein
MPAFGGLLFLAQIACGVHVVRSGRSSTWIYLILFVPALGMLIYLCAEVVPELVNGPRARRTVGEIGRTLNPGRDLREAMRRVGITATPENRAALAEALIATGDPVGAASLYREILTGVHATDAAMMLGLAGALFAQGDFAATQAELEALRAANPEYHSPEGHLLYARSLEEQGQTEKALAEYDALSTYYPGQEARCRYAQLLQRSGRESDARRLYQEICQAIDYGPRYQRREQRQWYRLAERGLAG